MLKTQLMPEFMSKNKTKQNNPNQPNKKKAPKTNPRNQKN